MSESNSASSNSSLSFEISPEASEISLKLTQRIKSLISEKGNPIDFETFMQMALYEPKLGYYQNNLHKFGEKGDFITAPEMGSLFAECIANSVKGALKKNSKYSLLEIGAGSGQLAVDLIKFLKEQNCLPKKYFILEPSATLQAQQQDNIRKNFGDYAKSVTWLSGLPNQFDGVIIANEVIDAIPCQIIEKTDMGWFYQGVDLVKGELQGCLTKEVALDNLPEALNESVSRESYVLGYKTEVRRQTAPWLSSLSKCLSHGHILLIDYGYPAKEYFHPQRTQGSLTCFINHHRHSDYLKAIGLQDITAHVDFSDVASGSHQYGFEISGYTTQAGFLLENGILESAERLINLEGNKDIDRYAISQQIQKLMMPGQMGEVLKVMSLSKQQNKLDVDGKSTENILKGFSMQDHLHRL